MSTKAKSPRAGPAPKQSKPRPQVNTQWFRDRLADKRISQRQFAKLLGVEPAAVTRMFTGFRRMSTDEAAYFASFVGATLDEVLRNMGVQPPAHDAKGTVPVVGTVNDQGVIDKGTGGPKRVPRPPECPGDCVALRYRAPESASAMMDGWLFYYAGAERVPPEAVGRLCVIQLANKGPAMLGVLRRGYEAGRFVVRPWAAGEELLEGMAIERASPILWVKTG